jgi:hypothetical protein
MSLQSSLNSNLDQSNQLFDFETDNNKKFNIKLFNENYDKYKEKRRKLTAELEQSKLDKINKGPDKKQLHELTAPEIVTGIKDSLFAVLDDILQLKVTRDTFLIQNRMFFLGLFIIIVIILSYVLNSLFPETSPDNQNNKNMYGMHHHCGCHCMNNRMNDWNNQ